MRLAATSRPQKRCTARWTCASGWRKSQPICSKRLEDPMRIASVDPQARVLSEEEVWALLREPILMRLGMVDGTGWPLVMPVWHVYEAGVFRVAAGNTSHKASVLRKNPRAYFTVDTGGDYGETRGGRGRASVRGIDRDGEPGVAVTRKGVPEYTRTGTGPEG